jgi:hypothetical protein
MMSQVAPDDFRREKWIDALGIHGSLRRYFSPNQYTNEKSI